ncbi:DUF4244 domain-containing protein [Arthrobacter sp. I2-34]|uniref:DUF4244 domain-containing protein n=1 Tax=Arthrobacter hankyongi TaxID=2904801 RepID=A0ABS9LA13_9MICC|nr:DUF4244 domain-containing protein [Arthrobacter hankyongi]MCG2623529.1 DUF4244 domain-containing protein [Arthrobacter hankyongi]
MLLALKKPWTRRAALAADTNDGVDLRQSAAGGPGSPDEGRDTPNQPLAEVIALPAARQARARKRNRWFLTGSDAGMATAEYAIATLAAVGFAGLLVLIMRSGEVRGLLMSIIEQALSVV